ncbi:MAG: nucleoside:proton symporter [Candidatus Thiodiazotropha sp. (ex Ctena orbiculata)]|uniref:Nucleoside:proton symporter n=1 Tax=Candidatus Thiodiazotropha taylori TaxID=2792791 RepID=A0A944M823_9GAMM|nr:nucleoside:proton symporter [Candidatus Thiodiazotropha taylori]PUB88900.1 MAG: nucleoside:proton symporter [gamma proteobacterium symbiont of Ctena orbiculata]MBT2988903.1 nucleoside:proton symporter [Candidatus Thiodiazotropha taylori]MBT2996451.1 nucleoside:proton symporter [Candidatus Thiodiazotropha taylori]MBT3000115.1 nucleoside:proton symporter [Candidatus Thiodiazotropha taylori]
MFQGVLGLVLIPLLAWLISENRQAFNWRVPVAGLALQLVIALLLLKLSLFQALFIQLNQILLLVQQATEAGTSFVFGYLGGAESPFLESDSGSSFILAFRALPLVLVISALSALLFYWRVLPLVVELFSWLLRKSLGVSGALGLGAAANVFVGMVESPLLIRPYLGRLTRSELFSLMTLGMATIAGTVLVLYASLLEGVIANPIGHLLTASLISAPAAIMISRLMVPETQTGTAGELTDSETASSSMEAITNGTVEGLKLLANIVAMLLVLVALVSLLNQLLGLLPNIQEQPLSLQRILGWLMAPLAWVMGIPWSEAVTAGSLLGTKTVLNELLAYLDLARLPGEALGERSRLILTYALCGFANFGSLGIMLGGLDAMVPERRSEIVGLGMKSIVAGTLATLLTGTVAGLVW